MTLKIKKEFEDSFVAFGGAGKVPLGKRSQEDLVKLAALAQSSKDKTLLKLFEGELPSLQELQREVTKTAIATGPVASPQPAAPTSVKLK